MTARLFVQSPPGNYNLNPRIMPLAQHLTAAWLAALLLARPMAVAAGVFPGEAWQTATPASQGVDAAKLEEAIAYLKENSGRDGVGELVIVRHGRVIWQGEATTKVHGIWSSTKSFTSTCLGLLIDDGKCTLDTPAKNFVPAMAAAYPNVTLRHFATMTSGYRALGDEPQGTYRHGPSRTPFAPDPKPLFAPGTHYSYWDSAMNQFGHVLTRIAGEPLDEFFKRRIADPTGMDPKEWRWGHFVGAEGLRINGGSGNHSRHVFISARQIARLGLLFLHRGNWNGRQLISSAWVDQAAAVQVPAHLTPGSPLSRTNGSGIYGFNWWVNGRDGDGKLAWPEAPLRAFAAMGHNNNVLFVIPEWDMVIARLGLDGADRVISDARWSVFLGKVGQAVTNTVGASQRRIASPPGNPTTSVGHWTARTFTLRIFSRNAPAQTCPEEANLDVKWIINLRQPDDGTLDHVNPERYYTRYVAARDTPGCYVSDHLGDHHQDWDYLVAWRDKVWADRGLGPQASLWEKVAAVAEAASATFDNRVDRSVAKDKVVVGEHAVDGIVKGTWCVGEANVMVAVASTMGLEGRTLGMADHTVCEIRVDGKWRFVENIDSARPHCLSTRSFLEFYENPASDPEMPARVGQFWQRRRGKSFVYGPGVGRYWQMKHRGGTYQVLLTPENAHALYPELTRIPTAMSTSLGELNAVQSGLHDAILKLSGVAPLKIGQNSGVRKRFYLSSVPDSLSSELFLEAAETQRFPADGGTWILEVNGTEYPLRQLAGFRLEGDKLMIPVPVSGLRAMAQNTVALRGKASGAEYFHPKLYYDYLMPRPAFYYDPAAGAAAN